MVDPAQTILFIVIIALSILLFVLGIQLYFVLKDFRQTLTKTNKVLDNVDEITENISAPMSSLASLMDGLKIGSVVAGLLKKGSKKSDE